MPIDKSPLPQRVASYYSLLSEASKDLNSISDELGKSIAEVDLALKKLNLGVTVWVPIRGSDGAPNETWYWSEDIGYAKIGTVWGISLRKVDGDHQRPDGDEQDERWLFNDAPRTLRILAIEKIPELFEKLSTEAVRTTKEIRARLDEVQAVAEAVKRVANGVPRVPLRVPILASKGSTMLAATSDPNVDSIRTKIVAALASAGHNSASQILDGGRWNLDGASLCIEVPGMGKKMLALTVNATAEKIIRQELQRLGGPARFLVVPAETLGGASSSASDSGSSPDSLAGGEK